MHAIIATVSERQGISSIGGYPLWAFLEKVENAIRLMTKGHVIIVGVKVYEILPDDFFEDRFCIIISDDPTLPRRNEDNCIIYEKSSDAVRFVTDTMPSKNIFFLGNDEIWKEGLSICSHMYVTRVRSIYSAREDALVPLEFCHDVLSPTRDWRIDEHFPSQAKLIDEDGKEHMVPIELIRYHKRTLDSIEQD